MRRASSGWVLVVVLAISSAAQARPPPPTPAERAEKLIAAGDFEKALALLNGAVKKEQDPAKRAELHVRRAHVLAILEKDEQARDALRAAVESDPEVVVDGDRYGPKLASLFDDARRTVEGELSVVTTPEGADITIDGEPVGPSPLRLRLPVGGHEVTARLGGATKSQRITVKTSGLAEVKLELPAATSQVAQEPGRGASSDDGATAAHGSSTEPASGSSVSASTESRPVRKAPIVLGAASVVSLAAGGAAIYVASGMHAALRNGSAPVAQPGELEAYARRGELYQTVGFALVGVGASAGIAAIVSGIAGGDSGEGEGQANAALVPANGGGVLVISGSF